MHSIASGDEEHTQELLDDVPKPSYQVVQSECLDSRGLPGLEALEWLASRRSDIYNLIYVCLLLV